MEWHLQIQNGCSSAFLRRFLPSSLLLIALLVPWIQCISLFSGNWFNLNYVYCACFELDRDRRVIIIERRVFCECDVFKNLLMSHSSLQPPNEMRVRNWMQYKQHNTWLWNWILPCSQFRKENTQRRCADLSYVLVRDLIKIRSEYHPGMPTALHTSSALRSAHWVRTPGSFCPVPDA